MRRHGGLVGPRGRCTIMLYLWQLVQAEYLALEGMSQLVDTVNQVREALNPTLQIQGVVMTMYDERTNLARQVVDEVRNFFGKKHVKQYLKLFCSLFLSFSSRAAP